MLRAVTGWPYVYGDRRDRCPVLARRVARAGLSDYQSHVAGFGERHQRDALRDLRLGCRARSNMSNDPDDTARSDNDTAQSDNIDTIRQLLRKLEEVAA